jgi:uncharacterized protein YndB with AHSA1/START domain
MTIRKTIAALAVLLPLGAPSLADDALTEINPNADIVADTALEIDAAPEAVWAVLTDVESWTEWLPEFASARLDGPLQPGTTLNWQPQGQTVRSQLVVVEPNKRLIWNGSGGAVHVWELTPYGEGTLLRNAESIEDWEFPGDHSDQSTFLAETLNLWNSRIAERVAAKAE